jgi:hypothetical protein
MITFSVKTNTKKLDAILKRVQQSIDDQVRVGIFAESVYPDGIPVAQVAKWNDLGIVHPISHNTIPPRPFITVGTRDMFRSAKFKKLYISMIRQILSGKITVKGAYEKIGSTAALELKSIIDSWSTPPNSAYTVSEKGFDDPLVWTGRMKDSIKHKLAKSRKKQRTFKLRSKPTRVR